MASAFPMSVLTPHPTQLSPAPLALWRAYRSSGDARLRDRLVFTLAPLVRHAGATTADEAEAGLRAVLHAVEEFSHDEHGSIEELAWTRIRAALAELRAPQPARA